MSYAQSRILATGQSSVLVTLGLLGMLHCNSILGIDPATCMGCVEGVGDGVVEEARPGTNAVGTYDPGFAAVDDAGLETPAPEGSPPPAAPKPPPADEAATQPAGEAVPSGPGNTPPPDDGNTPPAGGNTPPPEPGIAAILAASALGAASSFAVLAASTTTCTNASAFTGDVGVSPGTAVTGFNPSCTLSGALHAGDALAAVGHAAVANAFGSIASLACEHNLSGQDLGGQTLAPGVYCFDSSAALTGRLTLDGGGRSDAAWAFQIGSTLTTTANSSVVMAGGANACAVFWNVGSSATLATGTAFKGNVLATASVTLMAGSSVIGRILAVNAAVTSDGNQVGGCSN
jgi:Ice-binding-like